MCKIRSTLLCVSGALLVALIGCASQPAQPEPSAAAESVSLAEFAASGQYQKPMAWKAGQYVELENLNKGKRESVSKTVLVGQEKGGWIIETVNIDKKGKKSVSQTLFLGMDEAIQNGKACLLYTSPSPRDS